MAFEAIKALVVSCECLTTIDHTNLSQNQVSSLATPVIGEQVPLSA
jgi:hypothetical protein